MRGLLIGAVAACVALSACSTTGGAEAAPGAPWRPVDATIGRLTTLGELEQLALDFPNSASVQRRFLSAAARADEAEKSREALARLEAMKFALRQESLMTLGALIGTEQAAAALIRANALRTARCASSLSISVPADRRLVEGVAIDPRDGRMFLSSIADRALLRFADGGIAALPGLDAGSLSGLAIDGGRRLLWVASGVFEPTPQPDGAFTGLIVYDLDRNAVARRIAAPVGVRTLSDIAVARDGTVYASDPLGGGLYHLKPGSDAIDTLVAPGTIRSPQGIAVDPRGQRLYVSDYSYGIAIVSLKTGDVRRLASAVPAMLDGADGLYWHRGDLIAIQNGTSPMRIARLRLSRDGDRVEGTEVIEAAHPAWGEPTNGQLVGDDLVYIADPQWDRFGDGGTIKGEGPLRPNAVRRVSLAKGAPASACPAK